MKRNLHPESLTLSDFTGSESFYPFTITNSVLTEGTKYVAEELGAYWLMEKIDLTVRELVKSKKLFSSELGWFGSGGIEVANLKPANSNGAKLTIEDGNYNVLVEDHIEFTDLDFDRIDKYNPPELTIWVSPNGQGLTLYLPSER